MLKKVILLLLILFLLGCTKQIIDKGGNLSIDSSTYVNDSKRVEVVLCEDLNNNSICDDSEDDLEALEREFLEEKETEDGIEEGGEINQEEGGNSMENENAIEEAVSGLKRSSEYLNISSVDDNLTMWRIPKFTKIIKFYPNASISFGRFSIYYERDDISKKVLILDGIETLDFYSVPLGDKRVRVFLGDKDQFYIKTVEGWFILQVKSLGASQFSLGLIRIDNPEEEFLDGGIPRMFDY